jgi:DNA-binding CsgD family transcriptional regulator
MTQSRFPFTPNEWSELADASEMSPRQKQIAQCILSGMGDKQIAEEIGIKVPTVRTHMGRLFDKLDVNDRVELVLHFMHRFREQRCPRN